ncbi:hypothetical protein IA539_14235 [Gordonia sp. zg691]|uniref:hypothetical protein n=1 Tax=Gordonia jinghuaiqii TaxID=2758710 RepID=UPI00166222E5|nr:hypothetical protein [Gordonia jinghuaiqii]MBD0862366.1 hypothetical protein [Gordonia jinghuaiqii]
MRITTTGTIAVGRPVQPPARRAQRPFFAGSPPRLFYGGVVSTVNDDLTLGPHERLPARPVDGGALGDDAWVLTYRSTTDPEWSWWPIPEPDVPATPLPRVPILSVLESSTLAVKSSWRIDKHRSVTAQPAAVWVTDRDQLYRLLAAPATRRPELVEVAARITESIPPATECERRR